jgi:hypothetical protein
MFKKAMIFSAFSLMLSGCVSTQEGITEEEMLTQFNQHEDTVKMANSTSAEGVENLTFFICSKENKITCRSTILQFQTEDPVQISSKSLIPYVYSKEKIYIEDKLHKEIKTYDDYELGYTLHAFVSKNILNYRYEDVSFLSSEVRDDVELIKSSNVLVGGQVIKKGAKEISLFNKEGIILVWN